MTTKIAFFSAKPYDKKFFNASNKAFGYELYFLEAHLNEATAPLCKGHDVVCVFVNDVVDRTVIEIFKANGVKAIALRCAGFNNVDIKAADELGIAVFRVPAYSPYAVAEHAVALIMSLNRKTYRAYNRVREGNFSLEGLMGFDIHNRTIGIIGTGKIGAIFANLMSGFGCRLIAYDVYQNPDCLEQGVEYVSLEELYRRADIISLHCPLTPETHHIINAKSIVQMKDNVMIINTSRGGLVDTNDVIEGLKNGKVGYLGLDVYEEEGDLFFEDLSDKVIQDDIFSRLLTFPNVLITGHQAFFTENAVSNIAQTTLSNIKDITETNVCQNSVGQVGAVEASAAVSK